MFDWMKPLDGKTTHILSLAAVVLGIASGAGLVALPMLSPEMGTLLAIGGALASRLRAGVAKGEKIGLENQNEVKRAVNLARAALQESEKQGHAIVNAMKHNLSDDNAGQG